MFEKIEKRFNGILDILESNDVPNEIIIKAYLKAKELHKDQKRKDGTPYISHPVEVALILAKLGFDANTIAGALLHDTIEDCGYTVDEMRTDFNATISKLVDCVSAIDKTKYVFDKEDLFEDPEFMKSSIDEQTFKKLITLGKENPCGFAIKFADRLHNLRTISTFEYSKQLEKVRETEKWLIPIAKTLKSEYFYRAIKNECFKIRNQKLIRSFLEHYEIYHNANKKNIADLNYNFKEIFSNTPIKTIKISNVREYKVFEDLIRLHKKVDLSRISQGQIINVSNYNIFMIYREVSHKKALTEVINLLQHNKLQIIDIKIGGFTDKMYMVVEDKFKNKYNIYVLTENEYTTLKVGMVDGQNLDKIDEENINELDVDLIKVKTRSNEIKYIAKGSTVLDFAFKIHRDIGFSFKYALVNDSKTKLPPYTKLNECDKVEIITEKDLNGNIKNNAKLRWLAYVNTGFARKVLIKFFENNL